MWGSKKEDRDLRRRVGSRAIVPEVAGDHLPLPLDASSSSPSRTLLPPSLFHRLIDALLVLIIFTGGLGGGIDGNQTQT